MKVRCTHTKRDGTPCGYEGETKSKDGSLPIQCPRCKQYHKMEAAEKPKKSFPGMKGAE